MKFFPKNDFFTIVFILLFIVPHTLISVSTQKFVTFTYYPILVGCYFIFILFYFNEGIKKKYKLALSFALSFVLTGTLNLIIHSSTSFFNIIAPIISYFGFVAIFKRKIIFKYFDYYIILLYVFFYIEYYSVLPNLFFRVGFNEGVFENSSSNAIPISLNITLYAYLILNKFYSAGKEKNILVFSFINVILIIIQQSRAGIFISIIIFLISQFNNQKKTHFRVIFPILIIFFITNFFIFKNEIATYFEYIGNVNGIQALKSDVRGEAISSFFTDMNIGNLIFGYSNKTYGTTELGYTFNMYLEIWNKYGLFQLIIFFLLLAYRYIKRNNFAFPIYFLLPFLLYTIVEPRFFPSFWDVMVYILLFTPNFITLDGHSSNVERRVNTRKT